MKGKMKKPPLDHTQTAPALGVDFIAIDALFKRIAERGRKVRTQAQYHEVGGKEQSCIHSKSTPPANDNQSTKQVDE